MNALVLAGDAGGARALVPVIRRLRETPGVSVECRAYAAAAVIWPAAGFDLEPIAPPRLDGADRVVLGTSVQPEQWELQYIRLAERAGIRTVSLLDHWQHYRERFMPPPVGAGFTDDGALVLPDAIGVMDERARAEMIAEGFPESRLVVTGQPAFDGLAEQGTAEAMAQARRRLQERVQASDDERLILYASQPLSQLYPEEALGFHERDVLGHLVEALGCVLERRGATAALVIKPHPREAGRPYRIPPVASSSLRPVVLDEPFASPRPLIAGSDAVVGMHSLLLLEACLLGRPVVSYQPRLRIADPLRSNEWGWSRAVYHREGLEAALEEELFDPAARAHRQRVLASVRLPGQATERIVDLVMSPERVRC
jgi:hypothetical protein